MLDLLYNTLAEIPAGMKSMADRSIEIIRARTRQGLSADGVPFQPWSGDGGSRERKKKAVGAYSPRHGRRRLRAGKQVGFVDLNVTGQMLGALGIVEQRPSTFEPAGRGSKFRAPSGQFQRMQDVEIQLGIASGTREKGKAWVHHTGISPQWNRQWERPWLALSEQDASILFEDFAGRFISKTITSQKTDTDIIVMGA